MKKFLFSLLLILVMVAGCVQVTNNQPPTIDSFYASPGSISSGGSSTLSWSVSGATTVSLDQGIGNVALTGTRVVSPSTTTTYTLTATNDAGSVTATAQVMVTAETEEETEAETETETEAEAETVSEYTVTLYSVAEEDGSVREGGGGLATHDLLVGDDVTNRARQCFLSFDISEIPSGATITSASLDVKVEAKIGMPFAHLGSLRVYNDQYGSLGDSDFTSGFPSGQIYTYHAVPTGPFSSDELIDKLQDRVDDGDSRFQVRMQFEEYSDDNDNIDALRLSMPKLVITYEE
jgi:hypothetical protein